MLNQEGCGLRFVHMFTWFMLMQVKLTCRSYTIEVVSWF